MFATPEVVVFFPARMATKTGLRDFLGRFVFEGNDFSGIAFFAVGLAWSMTGFAAGNFIFPTAY